MNADRLPTCEVCGAPCPNAHIDIRKPGPNGSSIRHDLCDQHWHTSTASVDLDFPYRVSA
jgi:hypothetical protein